MNADEEETDRARIVRNLRTFPDLAREHLKSSPDDLSDEQQSRWENLQKALRLPEAHIQTNHGEVRVELFEDAAPNTVANFISLAEEDFYDGLTFHRVIGNFMIQGGDPAGDGSGGPDYQIPTEVSWRTHSKEGVLSMANAGINTAGSQFFITLSDTPHLDGNHTVFGRVTEGMDVVNEIGAVPTGPRNQPVETVKMEDVEILWKRDHEYKVEKTE